LSVPPSQEVEGAAGRRRWDRTGALGIFLSLFFFTVALMVLSIPVGVWTVFYGHLSQVYDTSSIARPYLWIGPIGVYSPLTVTVGNWFLAETGIYVALMGLALFQAQRPLKAMAASFKDGFSALLGSPFLVAVIAVGFFMFSSVIIDGIVTSTGAPIGGPPASDDPLDLLMGFTVSPLVEEFGFRVLLVGIVALILSMGRPLKDALGALWRPSRALEGLAVGSGASIIIWVATGLSALTFGACHVACGGGTWDVGKLPEATFGGLVLGVLYVKYGFHVAVIAHWGVDYFGQVYSFYGQAAYHIAWNSGTSEYVGQYLVDVDMLLLFGFASFLVVTYVVMLKVIRWRRQQAAAEVDKVLLEGGQRVQ
jgi:hypothetical protein